MSKRNHSVRFPTHMKFGRGSWCPRTCHFGFPSHLSKALPLPRKSAARSHEALQVSRKNRVPRALFGRVSRQTAPHLPLELAYSLYSNFCPAGNAKHCKKKPNASCFFYLFASFDLLSTCSMTRPATVICLSIKSEIWILMFFVDHHHLPRHCPATKWSILEWGSCSCSYVHWYQTWIHKPQTAVSLGGNVGHWFAYGPWLKKSFPKIIPGTPHFEMEAD